MNPAFIKLTCLPDEHDQTGSLESLVCFSDFAAKVVYHARQQAAARLDALSK